MKYKNITSKKEYIYIYRYATLNHLRRKQLAQRADSNAPHKHSNLFVHVHGQTCISKMAWTIHCSIFPFCDTTSTEGQKRNSSSAKLQHKKPAFSRRPTPTYQLAHQGRQTVRHARVQLRPAYAGKIECRKQTCPNQVMQQSRARH